MRRSIGSLGLAIGAVAVFTPRPTAAHFILNAPMSWMSQDVVGGPQKQSPCGDESGGTPTGAVTNFQPGEVITVRWTEIVPHDGWFRLALSYNNRADLIDPPYELNDAGNSVDAGIEMPPVAPVLVDGLFPHTAAGITVPKGYSYDLTLPTTPCDRCTLQVIQIMLNHPNNQPYGYTYHHCADISIGGAAGVGTVEAGSEAPDATATAPRGGGGTPLDAGTVREETGGPGASFGGSNSDSGSTSAGASGGNSGPPVSGGGGCAVIGQRSSIRTGFAGLAAVILAARRLRRRSPSGKTAIIHLERRL